MCLLNICYSSIILYMFNSYIFKSGTLRKRKQRCTAFAVLDPSPLSNWDFVTLSMKTAWGGNPRVIYLSRLLFKKRKNACKSMPLMIVDTKNLTKKQKNKPTKNLSHQVLQSDLVWSNKWPFRGLSDLQLGNQKVTLKKLAKVFLWAFWPRSNWRVLPFRKFSVDRLIFWCRLNMMAIFCQWLHLLQNLAHLIIDITSLQCCFVVIWFYKTTISGKHIHLTFRTYSKLLIRRACFLKSASTPIYNCEAIIMVYFINS